MCVSVHTHLLTSCEIYSAWTSQTTSSLNAVLLRDDSNCQGSKGIGKIAAIIGGVVFAVTIVVIVVILILLKTGVLRRSSYLLLSRSPDETRLN